MPSVALTYHKVLLLTSRFIWYIVGFSLTTRLLESCLSVRGPRPRPHDHSPLILLELGALTASLIFGAATDAALLGFLREPDHAAWKVIWTSVRTYTWVLFRLILLIALIAFAAMIPFLLLLRWLHWAPLVSFAVAFVYLVLIKYALAFPLVVDEQLNARQALKRSWKMTRGHFWYVLFCYLVMASAHIMVNQLFASPWLDAHVPFSFSFFVKHAADGFFDSLWIILGWQMYLDIKDADETPIPIHPDITATTPDS
jgi:hypothetical protein